MQLVVCLVLLPSRALVFCSTGGLISFWLYCQLVMLTAAHRDVTSLSCSTECSSPEWPRQVQGQQQLPEVTEQRSCSSDGGLMRLCEAEPQCAEDSSVAVLSNSLISFSPPRASCRTTASQAITGHQPNSGGQVLRDLHTALSSLQLVTLKAAVGEQGLQT